MTPAGFAELLNGRAATDGTVTREELLDGLGIAGDVLDHLVLTGAGPRRLDRWWPEQYRARDVVAYIERLAEGACR